MSRIPFQFAINTMITLLSAVVIFHILVLIQIIPYQIVWAGRLNSIAEMQRFETISILINCFIILIITIKGNYLNFKFSSKIIIILVWLFIILFSLNTIGNLMAKSNFEKLVFTPLTFILALLSFRIIKEGQKS
jgi:hypothetical protein